MLGECAWPTAGIHGVRRWRPFWRRRRSVLRPPGVRIRTLKPCVFDLRLRFGWNVRFKANLSLRLNVRMNAAVICRIAARERSRQDEHPLAAPISAASTDGRPFTGFVTLTVTRRGRNKLPAGSLRDGRHRDRPSSNRSRTRSHTGTAGSRRRRASGPGH